jgi:pyruvate kinase
MKRAAKPTRHECSDISNAVLDGCDGFFLDKETSEFKNPVVAVEQLVKCCIEAEKTIDWRRLFNDVKLYSPAPFGTAESVACASVAAVLDLRVDLIVVHSETGKLARLVSKFKPEVPIICVSNNLDVSRHMNIQRGIIGIHCDDHIEIDEQVAHAIKEAKLLKLCSAGAKAVCLHGTNEDSPDETNVMKIMNVE